jgi:hypothetical protein
VDGTDQLKAGALHIKSGTDIVLEAGSRIVLKVGGTFITLGGEGITEQGPMIWENCGKSVPASPDHKDRQQPYPPKGADKGNAPKNAPEVGGGNGAGSDNPISAPLQKGVKALKTDCDYLDTKESTVEANLNNFHNLRTYPSFPNKPKEIDFTFCGATADAKAIKYDIDVKGKIISIITPVCGTDAAKAEYLEDAKKLTKALGALNKPLLENLDTVVINDAPNPRDSYWQTQFGDPTFTSGATGGTDRIDFYPSVAGSDQKFFDSTMIHESSHVLHKDIITNVDPDFNTKWDTAMIADGKSVSDYADNNLTEDFAESSTAYRISKNTPCEDKFKSLYPERYKLLEKAYYNKNH